VAAFDMEEMEAEMQMLADHERYKNRSASLKLVAAGKAMGVVDWMSQHRAGEQEGSDLPQNHFAVRKTHKRRPLVTPICSRCCSQPSAMHCPTCKTTMCSRCDLAAHQSRFMQGHRRSSTIRRKDVPRIDQGYAKNPMSPRYIRSFDNMW
jgi:hypothetical protein